VLCCALPSTALPAASAPNAGQATPHRAVSPFGIPFPASHDPQAWQAWRQRVQVQLEARRTTRARESSAGATGGGIIETIAGAVPFQNPVHALKTGFGQIMGIAEDGSGNLYIASCDLGTVLKVDSSSTVTVVAGRPVGAGPLATSGDGGPATAARFACPSGIAVDSAGSVYVSDLEEGVVRKIDVKTGIIHTIAGIAGQRTYTGDGGPAIAATLTNAEGLALDGVGNLFINDVGVVRAVNLATGIIQTVVGWNGYPGSQPCILSATSTCPALQLAMGASSLAATPGRLYLLLDGIDSSSEGIATVDTSTWTAQLIAGGGPAAGSSATYPAIGTKIDSESIAVDSGGNVFYTDFSGKIAEISATDHVMRTVAGNGLRSDSGDGGPAMSAGIYLPSQICLSPKRGIDIVDVFRIRSFTLGGDIVATAGNNFANYFGDDGPATAAGLDLPSDVVSDSQGDVYVADKMNGLVRRIDATTGVITTIAGGGAFGVDGDGGPATSASLTPFALALDQANHLYVRSTYGVRVVDLATGTISTLISSGLTFSGSMVFDGEHTLYLTSAPLGDDRNSEVAAVDTNTGAMTTVAGMPHNAPGSRGDDGGPATNATLENAWGLALDGKGALFFSDEYSNNIRDVNLSTGIIETAAGHDIYTQGSYGGDGGRAIDAFLYAPTGLTYDNAGHLVFLDSDNDVVRQIDLSNNIITTIAGNHVRGFGGDGEPASGAMFYFPSAIASDPSGNLIIADTYNNRVRRVVLHPTKLKTILTYGGGQSPSGDSITYTATYSGLSFGMAPTGTVTFLNGSTSLGSGMLAPASDGSGNYVATVTTTSLPADNAVITTQYSGDVHYAASTTTVTFKPLAPFYTVSADPASLTVKQGSSGSIAFTVTPQNGFNQAVSFHCDGATLPTGASCSFSPAAVTPDGSSAVTTTLTVLTSGVGVAALDRRARPLSGPSPGWLPRSGVVLALVLLGVPRVRRRTWMGSSALMLFALCLTGILGCGGGSKSGGDTQNANATPVGTYSIQVTTSVGAASGIPPVTVSLTVTE
jgi:sugar lactone lactonase YvrE